MHKKPEKEHVNLTLNCQLTFWFVLFLLLKLLSLWRTLSHKRISPNHPCFLKQQPEPFRFWMEASSLRYDENWQNQWPLFALKRNIKFSFAQTKRIFDGFKNWCQNNVSVEPGMFKPAGIAQIYRNRMLGSVLIIYWQCYQCWTLPVLGQWPKKLIWATKFFISVAQAHL